MDLHPTMMKEGLVGLDVLPVAVHLTAAMLAGMYPQKPFDGECLLTLPYGRSAHGLNVGSLDLLNNQATFAAMEAAAEKAGPMAAERVHGLQFKVGHGSFNLVIMNPPFTRKVAQRTPTSLIPAFAAFDADSSEQRALKRHLQGLAGGGHANSKAGLASHFVELAHRKLEPGGKMALVLPLSALSGVSWERVRKLWRTEYSNITVVTIAGSGTHARSFSADTDMAECMIVADRRPPTGPLQAQATFVMLAQQSPDPLVGAQLATAITDAIAKGVEVLEKGPHAQHPSASATPTTATPSREGCPPPGRGLLQASRPQRWHRSPTN